MQNRQSGWHFRGRGWLGFVSNIYKRPHKTSHDDDDGLNGDIYDDVDDDDGDDKRPHKTSHDDDGLNGDDV